LIRAAIGGPHSIVSQGIIDAVKDDKITKPIVVRMKGTGSEDAAKVVSTVPHLLES
jgi:succinyl-CoA synthetase beta subunit